jgi:predicted aldo/keto reductase-like oxidoreductase
LHELRPEETIPAWSFRFLQSIPGVTMILSGMSNAEQMKQNIATFENDKPLNEKEMNTLLTIADTLLGKSLSCTSCHYCVSHCPQGLDIPSLLKLYNEHVFTGGGFLAPMAIMALPDDKKPAACRHCHSCEKVCPQGIKISDAMTVLAEKAHW